MYIVLYAHKERQNECDELKMRVDKVVGDYIINAYETCIYHAHTIQCDTFFASQYGLV